MRWHLIPAAGLLIAATPGDRHAPAVAAIAQGLAAQAAGDSAGLAHAARRLQATGARPVDGGPRLEASWSERARVRLDPPLRGRLLGPAYRRATLAPGTALVTEQLFLAGQRARASVIPAAGSTLQLHLGDGDGRTLCRAEAVGQPATCEWLPAWTGRYRLEVRNLDTRPAALVLLVD